MPVPKVRKTQTPCDTPYVVGKSPTPHRYGDTSLMSGQWRTLRLLRRSREFSVDDFGQSPNGQVSSAPSLTAVGRGVTAVVSSNHTKASNCRVRSASA